MERGIEKKTRVVLIQGWQGTDKERIDERKIIEEAEGGEGEIRKEGGKGLGQSRREGCSLRGSLGALTGLTGTDATVCEDVMQIRWTISYEHHRANKQRQARLKELGNGSNRSESRQTRPRGRHPANL